MQLTARFAAITLCACFLAALSSYADDSPTASIVGYRCDLVRRNSVTGDPPESTLMICQIGEDAEPFSAGRPTLGGPTAAPNLDVLVHVLTLLDNARHDASLQRHGAVVKTPTH